LMPRAVLEGPSDSGKSSYQLALTVCEHCGRGTVQGSGEPIQVEPEVVEMAACDAQQLGRLDQARMDAHAGAASERDRGSIGLAPLRRSRARLRASWNYLNRPWQARSRSAIETRP
jgi:hypothetical protein